MLISDRSGATAVFHPKLPFCTAIALMVGEKTAVSFSMVYCSVALNVLSSPFISLPWETLSVWELG